MSGEFLKRKSQAENSWSGSHMTTIIQNFTLVSLTSSVMSHSVRLPFRAAVPSLPMHLSPYTLVFLSTHLPTHSSPCVLVSLCTRLPMYSSYRYIRVPAERTFRLGIYLRSSTCRDVILDYRSTRRGSWAVGWTQLTLFPCLVVSLIISRLE